MSGKKEDDKPPPAVGPGSVIRALAAPLRKHLPRDDEGVIIAFSTAGMKALPLEVSRPRRCVVVVVVVVGGGGGGCGGVYLHCRHKGPAAGSQSSPSSCCCCCLVVVVVVVVVEVVGVSMYLPLEVSHCPRRVVGGGGGEEGLSPRPA